MQKRLNSRQIKKTVKASYGEAALHIAQIASNCCGPARSVACCPAPISSDLYDSGQRVLLPEDAVLASLGCGNPTRFSDLKRGQTVLDLGSGGGIDVLLAARLVGRHGRVYGLDMTEEMLGLARENQRKAHIKNVEFLNGEIENVPLPDNSIDVIISNCAINLSWDKNRALREAFRVLKPGGRLCVCDVVVSGELPSTVRQNILLWVCCIAGPLQEDEYITKLLKTGFDGINLQIIGKYNLEDARAFLTRHGVDLNTIFPRAEGKLLNVAIQATKHGN